MNGHRIAIALMDTALLIGLAGWSGAARCIAEEAAKEASPAKPAPTAVAVMDVSRVFKDSKRFTAEMEEMKADVKKAEERFNRERDEIKSAREQEENLVAGSEKRIKEEDRLDKLDAALAASAGILKKTFTRREADIYNRTYDRIEAEVAAYAKENRIGVVIRVNSEPMDLSNPENIRQRVTKPVVWFSPKTDITSIISERLDRAIDASGKNASKEEDDTSKAKDDDE